MRLHSALLALGLTLAGCSTTPGVQTVVDDRVAGHALLVQIEASTSEAGAWGPFAHPVAGGEGGAEGLAGRLDGLLAELAYARPKGKKVQPLMGAEDRQRLAVALAEGLSTAAPDERVRFVLEDRGGTVRHRLEHDRLVPLGNPRRIECARELAVARVPRTRQL